MSGIGEALLISAAASLLSAGISYALTPIQKIEGNRLDNLVSGNSSYGSPLPWAWGTVRLPGNKIWLDYLEEKRKTESQGGGFFGLAPKVETTTYNYYGYWAEEYAECPFRPAQSMQRSWMNKKLIYSTIGGAETIAEGGKFAEQYLRFYNGAPAQNIDPLLNNKQSISSYSYGIPTDPAERDAFLRSFGIDPISANLTPAYNYRTYSVWQRVPLGDFFNSIPTGEAELVFDPATVGQIVGDIFSLFYKSDRYDVSLLTTPVKGFTIDSIGAAKNAIQTLQQAYFFDIVDSNGVYKFIPLNHPRDVVNLRIEDLAAHTGDSKPVDYEIIEADPASLPSKVTVQYIDPDLNYDSNQQDSQLEVKGHYNPNPTSLSFSLVMSASEAATIADRALILSWIQKYTYKFQLPPAYLGLEPADLIANIFDDRDIPIKLTKLRLGANLIIDAEGVGYDPYFWNLVRQLEAGGITLGVADYNIILEVSGTPTAVTDGTGTIYVEGTDYTITNEGDIQVLSSGNIESGTELIVSSSKPPEPDSTTTGKIISAGPTELLVLDIPLIRNEDADYTIYLTGGGGGNWNGASIYVYTDNSRYIFATTLDSYGIYGSVSTLSGNSFTVFVNRSELESITDADLNRDLNMALIGNEIIQFKIARLVDINTYELSELTRGLRGTENFIDSHKGGDRFVLLKSPDAEITRIVASSTNIGRPLYFKALSSGQSLDEVEPVTITYQGISQRPYAPINLRATKNGVGDITISWDRRDRHHEKINPPILSEEREEYSVEVLDGNNTVRSYPVNKSSTIYTADMQKADFGSVQSTVTLKIAQVSAELRSAHSGAVGATGLLVGNGSFATATLIPEYVEPLPTIYSFTPASGSVGTSITVVGANLASVTEVKIASVVQDNLAVIDNQTVEFILSTGTPSGNVELITSGGQAKSANALIVEQPFQTLVFPVASSITLPYTLSVKDAGKELIINAQTSSLLIPDLDTGFIAGWGCWVSLDGDGSVTIERESGDSLGILGVNAISSNSTVKLWHRGGNVWKID